MPVQKSEISVQCELGPNEKTLSKVKKDLQKSEHLRHQLTSEQSYLTERIAILEESLKVANDQVATLEKATVMLSNHTVGALQSENDALSDRLGVSETALRRLHQEHAKLVAELKVMRNIQLAPTEKSNSSYVVRK